MNYVVLGASAAGINGILTLRERDPEAKITLISKDDTIYSRCILHHYIEGIRDEAALSFVSEDFIEKNKITWLKNTAATGIDSETKQVLTSTGDIVPYDKLLIATGSHVFFPPIEGLREATNAIGFHDLDECKVLMEKAKTVQNIVVMGAGLVGIDVVTGLLHLGKSLTLVEMKDHILPLQLDQKAASTYEKAFEKAGVKQLYSTGIASLVTDDNHLITSLTLTTGETIPCDLLVVASGVRANVSFLEGSGIEVDRLGLVINEKGETSIPDVYGAGDVTGRNPIWPVAVKEGIIAASNMTGQAKEMTDFFASKATMNFLSIPTLSLGLVTPDDDSYTTEIQEDEAGNYKKIVHKEGKIYGALLQGDLAYAGILTQLIRLKVDISKVNKPLFAIDYSDFFNVTDNFEFTY